MTDADRDDVTPGEFRALRERLHCAVPPAPETTGWVSAAAGIRRRRRNAMVAVGAAAVIALSGGAVAAGVLVDQTDLPPSGSPRQATVYLLRADGEKPAWRHYLVPVQMVVPGRDSAALEAARALVEYRPSDDEPLVNGWNMLTIEPSPIAEVVDVRLENDLITVELDRDVWDPFPGISCDCPPGRVVVQQLVYTVQEALDSDVPVQFMVGGEPARGVWLFDTREPVLADPQALAVPQ